MRTITTLSKGYKALLLVGCAGAFVVSAPAAAQVQDDDDDTAGGEQIIVTGSRILRPDYENNSPTVTVDNEFLQQSSTAAVEQQLNKLPQFVVSQSSTTSNNQGTLAPAGADVQSNAFNTPGAATLSLRGIGASRTLVLIDGRRGTPTNTLGAVDISTIPSSAIERVEVISGGASATYGADAVAGVTNFILRKDFQGLELDAQTGFNEYGDGFEYQISGIMGADFDDGRGNVSLAMSTNSRNAAYERNRPWFEDLWSNPEYGGNLFGFIRRPSFDFSNPAANFAPGTVEVLFPGANPPVPTDTNADPFQFGACSIYGNSDGTVFTGTTYACRGGASFFKPWGDDGETFNVTSAGTIVQNDRDNYLTVPLKRYNMLAQGNYEINDWIGVFAQGMFSQVKTNTRLFPGNITFGWDANIPWGTGTYVGNGYTPSSVLADGTTNPAFIALYDGILPCATPGSPGYGNDGCTNTEAFEQVVPEAFQYLLNSRANPNAPAPLRAFFPEARRNRTEVNTYSLTAGFEGSVPSTDWTWEAFVSHGVSSTLSVQRGYQSLERVRAIVSSPNFGENFSYTGNQSGSIPGFGASSASCTTGFDFFNTMGNADSVSEDCSAAIRADQMNKSTFGQTIAEVNLQGKVFDLPAGELRAAVGASYREQRYEFIPDGIATQGSQFLDQPIGIYPSSPVDAKINTKEIYGELLVPVLSDIPFIQQFNLELGGRISDYSTTGTSYTYKILGDWEVNDWLRFRGGYNRAERAPNMGELFLPRSQSVGTETVGDLCSPYLENPLSANPEANPNAADVRAVCVALINRDQAPGTADTFYAPFLEGFVRAFGGAGGLAFITSMGNEPYRELVNPEAPELRPEKADTWTAGVVINSPVDSGPLSRLRLSADYFNIKITDPIGLLGAGALQQLCVDPTYNPLVEGAAGDPAQAAAAIDNTNCDLVSREGFFGTLSGGAMISTWRNEGLVKLSGIDAQLDWSGEVGPGNLFVNLLGSYMFDFKVRELDGDPLYEFVGTQGSGSKGLNYGSSFEYRIFGTVGYSYEGATLSLQWQHTPAAEDSAEAISPTDNEGIPAYNLFNLNGSYQLFDNVSIRFGIDNLFNKRPPLTGGDADLSDNEEGALRYGGPGSGYSFFHDLQGRRFSLGANMKF